MSIQERWTSEETKIGKFLKYYIGYVGIALATVGQAIEYTALVPQDWLPSWLKTTILVCGVAGYVLGKLTKDDKK